MKRRLLVTDGRPALGMIEEAFVLLRHVPWGNWLWYLAGTLPFLVAALYLWSDLSTSPYAGDHLVESAALMLLLFLVAKAAQIRLVDCLETLARGLPSQAWTLQRFFSAATLTLGFQPLGLILIPVSAVLTLPVGWVFPFFQSLTVMSAHAEATPRQALARAWHLTKLWPVQNHVLLSLMSLFGAVIFFNLLALGFALPQLVKMLTGVESALTRSPWSTLNSTLLASVFGVTMLLMDPLTKAVYVLRCFYGESTRNGEDLMASLRTFQRARTLALAICLGCAASMGSIRAGEPMPPSGAVASEINSQQLDQAIQSTLAKREYLWRLPRDPDGKMDRSRDDDGFWSQFWEGLHRGMSRAGQAIRGFADRVESALKKFFGSASTPGPTSKVDSDWLSPFRLLAWLASVAVVVVLAVFGWRLWQRWAQPTAGAQPHDAIAPAVDLLDERVQASQLPQESWLALAQELVAQGELRLAMRAFYLASLAQLAQRHLITLAAFKSNRDYVRDLHRRAHALPQVHQAFADQVESFERVWYGNHPVDATVVARFARQTETLREANS